MTRPRLTVEDGGLADPPDEDAQEIAWLEQRLDAAEASVHSAERAIAQLDTAIRAAEEERDNGIAPHVGADLRARREEMVDALAKRRRAVIVAQRDLERAT